MDYNQAHNYNPAITLCNKDLVYPADFAESYVEELTGRIMQTGDADAYLIREVFISIKRSMPKPSKTCRRYWRKNPIIFWHCLI